MLCFGKKSKKLSNEQKSFGKVGSKSSSPSDSSSVVSSQSSGTKFTTLAKKWVHNGNLFEDQKILQHIFGCLSKDDLLRLRLVNKFWNKNACEVLREKLEGVIILQRGLEYYTNVMRSSLNIPIGRVFLNILDMDEPQPKSFFRSIGHSIYQLVLNLEGRSVLKFQTVLCYLQNTKQLSINLFDQHERDGVQFFQNNSRKVSTLSVPGITVEDFDEVNNNQLMTTILPNLESIILSCEPTWKTNVPLLLEQLLQGSPKLKNLNLQKWPFPLTQNLFEQAPLNNLAFLAVSYIGDASLRVLALKRLQLKSVDFNLDSDVVAETLDMFFESVSSTMEYIRTESNHSLAFRLQTKMPKLLTVRLTTWVGPIVLDTLVGNSENLMKIQLSNCDPGRISVKHPKSNLNVKYLAVKFGHFSTVSQSQRSEVVKNFVYAFPNLETLMMREVSDGIMVQILNGWPKLKTLRVTSAFGLTDSGLSGIPASELSKMTKLEYKLSCGCCLPVPVVDWKPCLSTIRKNPHIGKLTNLLDLSIESEEGSHFPLTNFSLHLGVHELVKLQSLKLTCHNELGPHWCFKWIAENLTNLEELTVMDRAISHDRYEEDEVLYLLRKLPKLKLHLTPTKIVDHHSNIF